MTAHVINLNPQPSDGAHLNPIVIGWWPRFAPGMIASPDSRALRCRSFAWAGFPLRLSGARFDPAIPALATAGIADVAIAVTAGSEFQARALAAGDGAVELFDWEYSPTELETSIGSWAIPGALFSGFVLPAAPPIPARPRFTGREVDGAELRIHWAQSTALTGLAAAADSQGRSPRLGATDAALDLTPQAPATGIRLRCVAPTRVLAVEEVR